MATTMWKPQSDGTVRGVRTNNDHWARYDASGVRIETGNDDFGKRGLPTADELAAMDAEAPVAVPAKLAERAAETAQTVAVERAGAIRAKFDGRGFRRGDWIVRGERGWVRFDAAGAANDQVRAMHGADLGRLMDAADSSL
ncbi:MAG: hypothetical protein IT337_01580 [Thermomicrobiales bacterium]|nr:hypothetical protein [Thermomicrobiales bacterium]